MLSNVLFMVGNISILQLTVRRAAENHRAGATIADEQRRFPFRRGLVIPKTSTN
jgi:hypothetical protein